MKANNDKIPEYIYQPRGWFERNGKLFITTINYAAKKTVFVSYNGHGLEQVHEIILSEPKTNGSGEIVSSGTMIVPREPPTNKDGDFIKIVGIPETESVLNNQDMTPQMIMELITEHINKYCDLKEIDVKLCVYYIFMSWYYQKLTTLPYLRFRADTGKGKSRILRTVADLTLLPVFASGASTAAGIIRFQEYWHGTLVIDEADLKGESDDSGGYTNDMIKFLNLGFERGQYFIKADKMNPRKQEVFDPFSPKMIAMRGTFQDPATEGRCLSISPSETERKDIPAVVPAVYYSEVARLRALLARYTLKNWGIITDADPYPSFSDMEVEPRLKQLGSPMARVLMKLFPDGMVEFKHYLEQRQKEIRTDRSMSFFGSLANIVYDRAVDPENQNGVVTIQDVKDISTMTANKISRALKEIGFSIEPKRSVIYRRTGELQYTPKSMTVKAIVVKDERTWREICSRYILPKSDQGTLVHGSGTCDSLPCMLKGSEFISN